jgi:MoaA/NifB/PqqE/SkfB family radical SAM enzyme
MTTNQSPAHGAAKFMDGDAIDLEFIETARRKGVLPRQFKSPLTILWDLTYHCTLRCIHCYNCSGPQRGHQYDELSLDDMFKVVQYCEDYDVLSVCLCGGDVLINPNFWTLAEAFSHLRGTTASTILNGWLLTPERVDKVAQYFETVEVSLDGAKASTHDLIRGRIGSFDRALNGIKQLTQAGVKVMVGFSAMQANYKEFRQVVDLVSQFENIESVVTCNRLIQLGRAHNAPHLYLNEEQQAHLETQVAEAREDHPNLQIGVVDNDGTWIKQVSRKLPNQRMMIEPNGTIKLTPFIPVTFGNIKTHDLAIVWRTTLANITHNPLLQNYLEKMIANNDVTAQKYLPYINEDISFHELDQ